jgi:16S rRNA (cytosine1402-N4)-methyltransferase
LSHQPVLLNECVDALSVRPDGVYLDATVGAGGHAAAVAERLTSGLLLGLDRDPDTLEQTKQTLKPFGSRVRLIESNYVHLKDVLDREGVSNLDGVLFDLGVSSMQLDQAERGFSFMRDGPLDMRMGPDATVTAAMLVNESTFKELLDIIRANGEERFAKTIAKAIMFHRNEEGPITSTLELAELIENAYPAPARRKSNIHPATRTFQALRIAVNDELGGIEPALEAAFDALKTRGRLAIISFHSLEDRIVKEFFKQKAQGCTCPPRLPACVCGQVPEAKLISSTPPSKAEIESNPRARSARLRVLEKLSV